MFEEGAGEPDRPVGRVRMRLSRAWERLGFALTFVLLLFSDLSGRPVNLDEPPPPPHPFPLIMATVNTGGTTLAERAGPSTYHPITGHLADTSTIGVLCQTYGQALKGTVGTSAWWELDSHGRYVSDAWLVWSPERPPMPWCGANTHRPVAASVHTHGATLSIRTGPSTGALEIGTLDNGTSLNVACRSWGQFISGRVTNTATWDQLADGGYVSDAYVRWAPDQPFMPWCGEEPQSVPPATRQAFIAASVAPARAGMAAYRVPASVTIAQAILESGAGVSTLTRVDHSLFGMKCFGSPGPVAVGCRDYGTYECSSSRGCYHTSASFRAYKSATDSFLDHAQALATLARYRPAFLYVRNPDQFAVQLQKGGYATDTHYANSLIRLMKQYNLYQYDAIPTGIN